MSTSNVYDFGASKQSESETFLQPKILGYRQLSKTEVSLMNEGKQLAEQCGVYIEKLRKFTDSNNGFRTLDNQITLDQRWISIGATDLQRGFKRGFMLVIRGIAQPTTF